MSNIDRDTAAAGGFGKMLTSLQGLQQRLEDFSIADVANAEANAQTLILRLRQVSDTIASVALLKLASANIDRSLEQSQQADLEAIELDSLENHPQLHAIVNANKLIKLHRLMAALKAGTKSGATNDQVPRQSASEDRFDDEPSTASADGWADDRDLEINQSDAPYAHDLSAAPISTVLASEDKTTNTSAELATSDWNAETDSPRSAFDGTKTSPADEFTARVFPTAEAEFASAVAAGRAASSPVSEPLSEDFPALDESLNTALAAPAKLATNFPEPSEAREIAEPSAKAKPAPALNGAGSNHDGKALVPTNGNFDLRLLDDLVSNYGEFATNPNLPARTSAKVKSELQVFTPAVETAQTAAPAAAEPAETAMLPARNTGELDRQLKKIIKDYGEYDLYSDKPTTNLKKAGIIAFVFLGLVFGGIYFFRTPPPTAKTAPAASNQESGAASAESKPQAGAEPGDNPKQTNLRQKN